MQAILQQINGALDYGFYYLAVATALTLPDICAAVEADDGTTTKPRYLQWYEKWLAHRYPMLPGLSLYALRCGISHQGTTELRNASYQRIVFVIPHVSVEGSASEWHTRISEKDGERVLTLDSAFFCTDMMDSVTRWYHAHENDPKVQANIPRVLQFRPNGLPPHFVGPVIA